MKDLIPRLFEETEARRHGIQSGWYGTKQSGTFVTGPSPTLEDCIKAMNDAPEPAVFVDPVAEIATVAVPPKNVARDVSGFTAYNAESRASYRIGRRPR